MAKLSPYETGELTDSIFFTLLVLTEPIHGYLIMQKVAEITDNNIIIGPATMYTTLGKMVSVGWIEEYHITPKGMEVLEKNLKLRQFLLDVAKKFIGGGSDE